MSKYMWRVIGLLKNKYTLLKGPVLNHYSSIMNIPAYNWNNCIEGIEAPEANTQHQESQKAAKGTLMRPSKTARGNQVGAVRVIWRGAWGTALVSDWCTFLSSNYSGDCSWQQDIASGGNWCFDYLWGNAPEAVRRCNPWRDHLLPWRPTQVTQWPWEGRWWWRWSMGHSNIHVP